MRGKGRGRTSTNSNIRIDYLTSWLILKIHFTAVRVAVASSILNTKFTSQVIRVAHLSHLTEECADRLLWLVG